MKSTRSFSWRGVVAFALCAPLACVALRGAVAATKDGAPLRDALLREAELPVKASWRPMLRHLAEMHGRSVLPALAHLPHPYETIGPGYQNGRVFGHIDLTHVRIDTVRASPEHVRRQLRNEFAGQQADGLIPGIILFNEEGKAWWKDFKGFPPFWVASAAAYVDLTGDTPFLRECLRVLVRQIGWFEAKRTVPSGGFYYLDQVEDTWESGMDEGIRYDRRPKERAAAVDACSHLYQLYDFAARWSRRLEEPAEAWERKAETLRQFIREKLWDEKTGFFYDAWAMAEPAGRPLAFEGMWPLVVGAATPEQARRVIDEHLLNPKEFFTPHPIATVALGDPKFELRMWRGPTWNCMSYWAARGLMRYGRAAAAHQLLERALDATAVQFERTGTLWEFYHPLGGEPESLKRKESGRNMPNREYLGHNPLFAMADLWRVTDTKP
ncbi:MAG: trehalase family glycosidase [Verrucomicrobiota bacterium]